ncbi:MAG: altronate dehydratase [Candidatus Lokiarchaeota archaeon]|nr:altronate dehydratase [Candidatus Lokiarchaeota archaeon]MBD3340376.1 altronate dehydratase [Candidatus Lokiarchaeota archaeon]
MSEEFMGFERPKGQVGIRNKIVILPSVVCVNHVAQQIANKIENSVAITHPLGCGQFGPDFSYTQRTLTGLATNPNVYGVVVVGLGCENLKSKLLGRGVKRTKRPVEFFDVQEIEGGTIAAIEKGVKFAKKFSEEAAEIKREPFDLSHLVLGLECGGSDSISGISANPAVGVVSDKVVEAGGISILPEFTEWVGGEHLLAARAKDESVANQIKDTLETFLDNTMKMGIDFRGIQPTPGNIDGGLTTIEEKSLGTIAKAGKAQIEGIVDYSQSPKGKGLWLMIEPGLDVESMTGLAAAGAQVIIMTTGRGSPTGNPVSPVIKICGNPKTCDWMKCNIDIDASKIITEGQSIEEVADDLWSKLIRTLNGEQTKAEELGFEDIAIWRPATLSPLSMKFK